MGKWKAVVLLFTAACSGGSGRNPTLDAANRAHLEAIDLYTQAHHLYDSLKKDARERADTALVSRLDSIHDIMHNWEEGLYEVPGYAHSHHDDDDHGHKHEHKTAPKMTDQSILDYQENARQAILDIKDGLEKIVQQP